MENNNVAYAVYNGIIDGKKLTANDVKNGMKPEDIIKLCENDSIDIMDIFWDEKDAIDLFCTCTVDSYTKIDEDNYCDGDICWYARVTLDEYESVQSVDEIIDMITENSYGHGDDLKIIW